MPPTQRPGMPGPGVACIGECMVELRELPGGLLRRSWGGDTLNTALYLARLGVAVDYITALGDDGWSDEMLAAWQAEGIGTTQVHRRPNALPGLYVIQTDPAGERRFLYWRDSAAARRLLDHLDVEILASYGTLYLSGITLSIFDDAARHTLIAALQAAKRTGTRIVFDTNFRPRGWPDRTIAQRLYQTLFTLSDTVFASTEDLALLYGDTGEAALLRHTPTTEIVLKLDRPASRLFHQGAEWHIHAEPVASVIDTTAAGDSFAAAYLAARLRGADPADSARAGHALAGQVVGHPGAIMPLPTTKVPA